MKQPNPLTLTLGTLSILATTVFSSQSIQFPDGRVAFAKSPRLVNAVTTYDNVGVSVAKYYFTLELPANAEEPLGQVTIKQRQGIEDIDFRLDKTLAFVGKPRQRRENVTIQNVSQDEETNGINVTFDPPIAPGTTFTVGLKPRRNPDYPGIYLFGVTAFPVGEQPYGLYLGVGRLHFYNSHDGFIFR